MMNGKPNQICQSKWPQILKKMRAENIILIVIFYDYEAYTEDIISDVIHLKRSLL